MFEFHTVTIEELPAVNQWLERHLPESWRVYGSTREVLNGRWSGNIYFTLGWPEIRGVYEEIDEANHPSPVLWRKMRLACFYAPDVKNVEFILNQKCDWTKAFLLQGIDNLATSVYEKLAKEKGVAHPVIKNLLMMRADPGDIKARPIPDGFTLRPIDPETEAEYCASTWVANSPFTAHFFRALFARFPNVCLANSNNECVSFELGTEYGTVGMLYTREQDRGQGLAKVVVSHLVQEYFKDDLPVVAWVEPDNDPSLRMHLSLGFKVVSRTNVVISLPPMDDDNKDEILFHFLP